MYTCFFYVRSRTRMCLISVLYDLKGHLISRIEEIVQINSEKAILTKKCIFRFTPVHTFILNDLQYDNL